MAYNPYYNPYMQPMYNQNGAMPDAFSQMKAPYQNQPMAVAQNATTTSEMLWVLNEVEAQSYPVAPNNTVILWDKSTPTIYVKSNLNGVPSIRTLDFVERSQMPSQMPQNAVRKSGEEFVTLEQLNEIKGQIDDIRTQIRAFEDKPKTKTTKKGDVE